MIVNSANLASLRVGFKTIFNEAFSGVEPSYKRVAEVVTSTTGEEKYGWLGELPGMRKWIGPRVVNNLAEHDYAIKNIDYELTLGVKRNHIEDDTLGTYNTRFSALGRAAASHPDQLVFGALKDGFSTECYDGQNFFDTNHPVINDAGETVMVANTDGGTGAPWFLLATKEVIKPIIFQERKKPEFVYKDDVKDDNVFMKKEFLYGADSRCNVGYGFWQMAWGSKQDLNAENYATGRAALGSMTGDHGRPLGIKPNLLVVGASNEGAALKLVNNDYGPGGETNEWKGTAEVLVCPWL